MIRSATESCPICKRTKDDWKILTFAKAPDYEVEVTGVEYIRYVICKCGFMFQDMQIDNYEDYYRETYRTTTTDNTLLTEETRANRLIEALKPRLKKVKSALDFGSSSGIFLSRLRSYYVCQIQGVELSDKYRNYASEKGIPTSDGIGENKYDFISAVHVLEHVNNPLELLIRLSEALTGRMLIEVPFYDFRINHFSLFTEATLSSVIRKAKLQIMAWIPGSDLTVIVGKETLDG